MEIRIKEVRKKFGDTLQSLAKKIDYDYSNLSKVERGVYTPSLDLLNKIAQVYGINITELIILTDVNSIKKISLEETEDPQIYNFTLDGITISDDELDFLIQSVRIFRQKIKDYKDNSE